MVRDHILAELQSAVAGYDVSEGEVDLQRSAFSDFGDYTSTVAIKIAKKLQRPAIEVAQEIIHKMHIDDTIEHIEASPQGFINVTLSLSCLLNELNIVLSEKSRYGSSTWGRGMLWVIEHTSPNPNKAMHLGHLRNTVTGVAVVNLLRYVGVDVKADCIDNDRGIAIAKLMWGYLMFARKSDDAPPTVSYWFQHRSEWKSPQDENLRPDKFIDGLYTKAAEKALTDKTAEEQIRQLVIEWEQNDDQNRALWEYVIALSHEGQKRTLDRLKSSWEKVWHEHEHYQQGKDIVLEGVKRGVFKTLKDKAIITDLKDYKLSDTVLMKSDGTSLYITQDIALTKLKIEYFHPQKLFWVVGSEQSLALRQLFAVCEQLGIGIRDMFCHLSYGYMSLKDTGKMSSRKGNVVYIDDLIDQVKEDILKIMNHDVVSEDEREQTAETLAVCAVKYSILKVGRSTEIAFDIESSIALSGNSGLYLEYTYVRCQSILRQGKIEQEPDASQNEASYTQDELTLLRLFMMFPDTVQAAAIQYSPNLLCNYLFELAQAFNVFYQKYPILKETDPIRQQRVKLTEAVAQIIENGLQLLGIEVVNKM